ncbi:MAG: sulfide:quinone oxidoreductase [Sulfitobacter sp.]|jgi:sulfide:quinone oxidoreductase
MAALPKPVLAYCRAETRSATLWSLARANDHNVADILSATKQAGYEMSGVVRRIANGGKTPVDQADVSYDVVIVGAGTSGIAVAASLKARKPGLEVAIIDPDGRWWAAAFLTPKTPFARWGR